MSNAVFVTRLVASLIAYFAVYLLLLHTAAFGLVSVGKISRRVSYICRG